MINKQIKSEKEIDYNTLKLIQEHSKKYATSNDKKQFLKEVCAYEQKLILLQSKNPCEVLMYLAEIDTKSTNLVIEELSNEEIMKILEEFSAEDKKLFYSRFPNLSIVNRFILKDENSQVHVKDLPFERKTELMSVTNEETIDSATEIYSSLSESEKTEVTTNSDLSSDLVSKISESDSNIVSSDTQSIDTLRPEIAEPFSRNINEVEKFRLQDESILETQVPEEMPFEESLLEAQVLEEVPLEKEPIESNSEESLEPKDIYFCEKYSIIGNGEDKADIVMHPKKIEDFDSESKKEEQKELKTIKDNLTNKLPEEGVQKTTEAEIKELAKTILPE